MEKKEVFITRNHVGFIGYGGTILCRTDQDGLRIPWDPTAPEDLDNLVEAEFPDVNIALSKPAIVGYSGFSENINHVRQMGFVRLVEELLERPEVGSIIALHGSDTLLDTAKNAHNHLHPALKSLGVRLYILASPDPYPANVAKNTIRNALVRSGENLDKPGVYVGYEDAFIYAIFARETTYTPANPMKIYDVRDLVAAKREFERRYDVLLTADNLAKKLGYTDGIFPLMEKAIRENNSLDERGYWAPLYSDPTTDLFMPYGMNRDRLLPFPPSFDTKIWPVDFTGDFFRASRIVKREVDNSFPAILGIILHHSGTCYTEDDGFSVAEAVKTMRNVKNTITFGVARIGQPVHYGEGSYVTAQALLNAGVFPVPTHPLLLWTKLFKAREKGLGGRDLVDFVYNGIVDNEFTGPLDYKSIQFIKSTL